MGNIYEENGIKYMEVEYGWGFDMLAVHFPLELAIEGVTLGMEVASLGKEALIGKINTPELLWMMNYCNDVIENARGGYNTYILEGFHADTVREIKKVAKLINKLKLCKNK